MRLPDALLARVNARARELGQTRTTFTERALEAALSEAKGAFGPAPVPSSDGVRPAAQPRTPERGRSGISDEDIKRGYVTMGWGRQRIDKEGRPI
jgi:hypothetical protein